MAAVAPGPIVARASVPDGPAAAAQSPAVELLSPITPPALPPAPRLEVRYRDLSQKVLLTQSASKREVPSVARTLGNIATGPFRAIGSLLTRGKAAAPKTPFVVLDRISGVIRPGTLTL